MPSPVGRRRRLLVGLALLALALASAALRTHKAFGDPNFDRARPEGMLKSDPALLYHFTAEILAAGGGVPAEFAADRRVEWPRAVDVLATFSVGQEFLIAWSYALFGGDRPLHAFSVMVTALLAALAVLGAYGVAFEASGSERWGLFGALLWCLMPASYRTAGFVLMREDLSFPLFAAHLWLALRAARTGNRGAFLGAGVLLAAALATWHGMAFFVGLEACAALGWFVVTGRNPLASRQAGWMLAPVALACVAVPVLRSTGALLAPGLVGGLALFAAARLGKDERGRALALAAGVLGVGLGLRFVFASALSEHAHVFEVIAAKLAHLGLKPADPNELSFDARLLWQGPFETLTVHGAFQGLGVTLIAVPLALFAFARRPLETEVARWSRRDARGVVALLALLGALAAWLFLRVTILPALLLPAVLAVSLHPVGRSGGAPLLGALALLLQLWLFNVWRTDTRANAWYLPPGRNEEIARVVRTIPTLVPEGEAIASDFMTSTAVLAHTGHPIVLQPKYETAESRRRARVFLEGVYHSGPDELRRTLLEEFDCRYVLFDRYTLDYLRASRYAAGVTLPPERFPAGSAAGVFLSQDDALLESEPGWKLLYRSPPSIRQSNGQPYDLFRLYRLEPDPNSSR